MTRTLQHLDPSSLARWLPFFEEVADDIPSGYGIEHCHDGGYYPYRIDAHDPSTICFIKDADGLDLRCESRAMAVGAIVAEVTQ